MTQRISLTPTKLALIITAVIAIVAITVTMVQKEGREAADSLPDEARVAIALHLKEQLGYIPHNVDITCAKAIRLDADEIRSRLQRAYCVKVTYQYEADGRAREGSWTGGCSLKSGLWLAVEGEGLVGCRCP